MRYLLTIPARNEETTIAKVIEEYIQEATRLDIFLEIQVVDDNSTDETFSIVKDMNIPVYQVEHGQGLARVFRREMELALLGKADVFIHVDADGQHSAKDLHKFLTKIVNGYDLVLGNRLHTKPPHMPDINYAANILLSRIVSLMSGADISDSQTGYRAIRRSVAESVRISSAFTYTQEQILRAKHQGFTIGEVLITPGRRVSGSSRLVKNPFNYLKQAFADLEALSAELNVPLDLISKCDVKAQRHE